MALVTASVTASLTSSSGGSGTACSVAKAATALRALRTLIGSAGRVQVAAGTPPDCPKCRATRPEVVRASAADRSPPRQRSVAAPGDQVLGAGEREPPGHLPREAPVAGQRPAVLPVGILRRQQHAEPGGADELQSRQ